MRSVLRLHLPFMIVSLLALACGKEISDNEGQNLSAIRQQRENYFAGIPGTVSLWKRKQGYDCAVFLPRNYLEKDKFPVIISLHGFNESVLNLDHSAVGGTRDGFIGQVWDTPLSESFSGIVIAPNVNPAGESESMLWDRNELRDLILEAMLALKIDHDRIVVTGSSSGGIATQELLKHSGDLLAGGMPGGFQYLYQRDICLFADTPVWVFGSEIDEMFDAAGWGNLNREIKRCSSYKRNFKLTLTESQHWDSPEVQRWLLRQTRKHNSIDDTVEGRHD